ncbi:TetR/AcrR family transcriptional regulator [Alkalicoccus luteus]|uniref:TetR/AcrR family transcriptional regulator n=1 Tax=Alkalicoccus luteus TaxID=1237094 RepID=A0A969PRL2_9BACI|nr:TetR/AcrR family transcriptional regulator [Alkalicoccus luteus]NJP36259.1 TetR/AcrR family transcriptional regulator [Alkalicoccus luteus]
MTERRDRRIQRSRHALKLAFQQLLQDTSVEGVTVSNVAAKADVCRGTFYKHFDTKEALYQEVIEDVLEDLVISYRFPYQDRTEFVPADLAPGSIQLFEHVYRHQDFYRAIVLTDSVPGFQDKMCRVLRETAAKDLVADLPSFQPELAAAYFSQALFGLTAEWVRGNFMYTPAYMAEQLLLLLQAPAAVKVRVSPMTNEGV